MATDSTVFTRNSRLDSSSSNGKMNNITQRIGRETNSKRRKDQLKWIVPTHMLAGVLLSVLVLHPVTMAIYYFEFHPELDLSNFMALVTARLAGAFRFEMWPMTFAFACIGAVLGMVSGFYSRTITRKMLLVSLLDRRLGMAIRSLIGAGESAAVEFKASLRWDRVQNRCNKELEPVIVKSIAGFLNNNGGDLLIGVADDGTVVGLEADYATLRKKDRDGFELLLMKLIKDRLGGDVCTILHVVFHDVDGIDVCRVMIEPSQRPVFVQYQGVSRYYLRIGNSTRELDTKEAIDHVAKRYSRS